MNRTIRVAAIFIGPDGEICGHYRKVDPAVGGHPSSYFNRAGRQLRAFDTPIGRAGFVVCSNRNNPLVTRTRKVSRMARRGRNAPEAVRSDGQVIE